MAKFSIVAPIALTGLSVVPRSGWAKPLALFRPKEWQTHTISWAERRTSLLLRSFFSRFRDTDIDDFVIVTPQRDVAAIEALISRVALNGKVQVLSDNAFAKQAGISIPEKHQSGWYVQQVVKLAFSRICRSPFYLTMDSDIVTLPNCKPGDLFPDGERALIGLETPADYDELYRPKFARQECETKQARIYAARRLIAGLGEPVPWRDRPQRFASETPALLSALAVRELLQRLEKARGDNTGSLLLARTGWTEYALYLAWLDASGGVERYHVVDDRNALLSLDCSVWQDTEWYRGVRNYSADFFARPEARFIAIQSRLEPANWLPPEFADLEDFYRHVEAWLGLA